jgi:ribosomal-protein-alanine N-acetyltransferase
MHDLRSPVNIRMAKSGDLPFVSDLSKRVFQQYGPYEEILPRWFVSGRSMTILAESRGAPVGFAMMARTADQPDGSRTAEIMAIAVEPAMQGQGVGHVMMAALEKWARAASIRRIYLHTAADNVDAKALFSVSGFKAAETSEGFYPQGQDAVMMYKVLSD